MRILFVSNMYPSREKPYAGIFVKNQFNELQRQLQESGEIEFFYMERRFTGFYGSFYKYAKATVKFLPILFRSYDVVHLHFFYPLIYLVWFYKKAHPKARIFVTFHGSDINLAVTSKNQRVLSFLSKSIDVAIPVGETISRQVVTKLRPKSTRILPVGVDGNVFKPASKQTKRYDFIWVGSFYKIKGIDILIQAIKATKEKNMSFCFCGSGEYVDELKALNTEYNVEVKENLSQKELAELLNASRYFVLMSRSEGFPTATIEAMYCGLPILTSDISQFKEQVRQGENGYMVPLDSPIILANELIRLFGLGEEEYHKLSQGALSSFKEISLQEVCRELIEMYKEELY